MARITGAKCRICRRLGTKLFLKGTRCDTPKCPIEKENKPPGQHGAKRIRLTEYGIHMREVQRAKKMYGLMHRQFRRYYNEAIAKPGNTGDYLLQLLERRLDNVIYRLGFASDHAEARQLVRHGHFKVNGQKVNVPSFLCRANDAIDVKEKSKKVTRILESLGAVDRRGVPKWLELEKDNFKGKLTSLPAREDLTLPIREQLIVELYSR